MNTQNPAEPAPAHLLSSHQAELGVGARFRYTTVFAPYRNVHQVMIVGRERGSRGATWEVLRIEDRGVVIGHPMNGDAGTAGGHQHLLEWNTELAFFAWCFPVPVALPATRHLDVMESTIKTPDSHPTHPVVGHLFGGPNFQSNTPLIYFCDSHDSRLGYWMTCLSDPKVQRKNISERAINATYFEAFDRGTYWWVSQWNAKVKKTVPEAAST